MLQIQDISKQYKTGALIQDALNGVTLSLRRNEFVSILGPSGSGKTTLLNIIGGLDRYDSGDLVINGISTKDYRDRDWDTYRNHTIGFVFQSYNLIPHQSILSNVELALTIGGISRSARRQKARQALEAVGLGEQCHKRPNQLSGGQMQRVAIARALVNDPDILLADEPTGALDTETSIQVMELLKEVAKDRLVVMVTHNPELAEAYSTRIVKLRDGKVVSDSDPYIPESAAVPPKKKTGRAKMGFLTSLALSFNNLLTKKGRTLLTAFAGSIGIIGIALILALSTGVNDYISSIQKETMTSYPITISSQTIDMTSMMGLHGQMMGQQFQQTDNSALEGVYADTTVLETANLFTSSIAENDLTAFKKYLEDPDSEIRQYIGENGVVYTYNVNFSVYTYDPDGNLLDTDTSPDEDSDAQGFAAMMQNNPMTSGQMPFEQIPGITGGASSSAENFSELMAGIDGQTVSAVITDSYDLLYGRWPQSYDEVILVLDESNAISLDTMFQLGLITKAEYEDIKAQIEENGEAEELYFDYADVCSRSFYLIPACDYYAENEDGTFSHVGEDVEALLENGVTLKITGVIRPKEDASNASISTAIGYTSALTDYVIEHSNSSAVVRAQEADPCTNVLTGVDFEAADDEKKIADATAYISAMSEADKASLYTMIQYYGTSSGEDENTMSESAGSYPMGGNFQMDDAAMAAALDQWLTETPDSEILLSIYDEYLGGASYEENLEAFGKVSYDAPASISIYTDSFEDKEAVAECITHYNETADEDAQITYVDYVQLMTSSLTSIINVISYVLIAFVAVSLVVSCIMIGIITHISVLERTKEIGILRALGASKRNISQVFNAETVIIGLCSGLLGVGITLGLTVPINALLETLLGSGSMTAQLPAQSAVILIVISMVITVIGGLMPAKKAAKMDPVIALRTE